MAGRHQTRDPLDTHVVVETPEHIRFRHRLAGPTQRLWAYLIDLALRAAIVLVIAILAGVGGALGSRGIDGVGTGVILLVVFAVEWGYYVLFEVLTDGRSLGKKALGLRVLKRNGTPIGFGDSVLRNLLRAADFLPSVYALGGVVMARDRYFRRLGDLAADTIVVSEVRSAVREPLEISPPFTTRELRRLRRRVVLTADELNALEMLLRRHGSLAEAREAELAEMVAPIFAKRIRLKYSDPVRFLALLHRRATERGEPRADAR